MSAFVLKVESIESTWASDAESIESVAGSLLLLELHAEMEREKVSDKKRILVLILNRAFIEVEVKFCVKCDIKKVKAKKSSPNNN